MSGLGASNRRIRRALPGVLAALALLAACKAGTDAGPDAETAAGEVRAPGSSSSARVQASEADEARPRVLFLGTSLTAGMGLPEQEAYPARLGELLEERGVPITVVNAGVSGDTSAGGLARLDWLLREPPDVVLVELGANDGLRGLPVEMTEANLADAVARSKAAGASVIVAGMMMPPNYGEDYTSRFAAVFPRVAEESGSTLVPFLLDGVAAEADLNLADGIHPNAEGHEEIARTVLPYLLAALESRGLEARARVRAVEDAPGGAP